MDNQAKVTLTSLNGDVTPAQRMFFLSPDQRTISVGRASKSASKGLLGAANNAWFDSPVMSRHHALMTFSPDEKAIMIEDIGSMHGTYLNNVQLPSKNVTAVGNEDEIKFGAEVRRGPEVFPACRFRVNYEFVPYKRANSYEFPEYSDIDDEEEEDEECEFSDEVDARAQTSSEDDVSIESLMSNAVKANDPIDLTRDDSPVRSNLIDLTDDTPAETPAETALMSIMAGRPTDINESASYTNIAVYAGNPMTVCEDSEEEDAHFSSDSEDQQEDDDSESSSQEYGLDEVLDDILDVTTDGEVGDSDDEYPEEYPMEEDQEDIIPQPEAAMNSMHRFANATNDYTIVRLSEPLSADESSAGEEDNESDFGLSEAGAEGLKVLREGGLLESPPELIPLSTAPVPATPEREHEVDMTRPLLQPVNSHPTMQSQPEKSGGLVYVSFRQPSPSDAAMVKSQTSTTSAQLLGDISGKPAFFAAREVNKQKFISEEANKPGLQFTNPSGITKLCGTVRQFESTNTIRLAEHPYNASGQPSSKTARSLLNIEPSSNNFRTPLFSSLTSVDSGMPRRGDCAFLDMPDTTPMVHRAASPLPDMTSAMTYSAGKDILAAKSVVKSSVLKIQDLCSEPLLPQTSLKRKAQDISNDSGEELKAWGNGTSHAQKSTPPTTNLPNNESVIAPKIESPRPTKRFRKFLENAGYVAMGGVAVGGALFTALIVTAPDFA